MTKLQSIFILVFWLNFDAENLKEAIVTTDYELIMMRRVELSRDDPAAKCYQL